MASRIKKLPRYKSFVISSTEQSSKKEMLSEVHKFLKLHLIIPVITSAAKGASQLFADEDIFEKFYDTAMVHDLTYSPTKN